VYDARPCALWCVEVAQSTVVIYNSNSNSTAVAMIVIMVISVSTIKSAADVYFVPLLQHW
jgi:hypothetical protein